MTNWVVAYRLKPIDLDRDCVRVGAYLDDLTVIPHGLRSHFGRLRRTYDGSGKHAQTLPSGLWSRPGAAFMLVVCSWQLSGLPSACFATSSTAELEHRSQSLLLDAATRRMLSASSASAHPVLTVWRSITRGDAPAALIERKWADK